ncbi:AMP-binding protein [Cupriavidus oxalaticus]|uniref:AMP-dependent synthetase n=1 Tax=Cupriavidus oxalaticus TaxID=96344 RepID=A0A5P3VRK1_9BURK|nr:AMP-binding protein [Cupriavidus oxalaticus]QEZ49004.1 AMP-dependent synthetase [Cupriavidus oxalaticus]
MSFPAFLRRAAQFWGDRTAVRCGARTLSYRALDERSTRLANALYALGLAKGDRVAIQARNCVELVEIECALYKAGLVKAAMNARFSAAEVSDLVQSSAPRVLIAGPGFTHYHAGTPGFESIEAFVAIGGAADGYADYETLLASAPARRMDIRMAPGDLAVLHFSSGSTGKVKAAMQSYGNRLAAFRKVLLSDSEVRAGDRLALLGPVTHASGMLVQPNLFRGTELVLFERFDPAEFLDVVGRLGITHTMMVPAMLNMLLAEPGLERANLATLRALSYGAAPMAPARIREAWERIGPILAQGYGASESTSGVARLSIADHAHAIAHRPERLASCGRPFAESEVRVVDEAGNDVSGDAIGEIVIRGDDVFQGYWGEPALTAETIVDGWLHTGDLARVDEDGYLYLVDRKKDMIISGGFNVYPTEVEAALYRHPDVFEACVIGVPDPTWGESVKAVIALKAGAAARPAELIAHCRTLIADYKAPKSVELVQELPKNPNGKLARKVVREPYWQGVDRRVN